MKDTIRKTKIPALFNTTEMSKAMEIDDPKVIKLAKLALIVASSDTELKEKYICIKLAIKQGTITEDEGAMLLAYRPDLEDFASEVRILEVG